MVMIKVILLILAGYLMGSIPWGLIIGKLFYNTDIRQFGSGNLGGTNATRVLGKKAGYSVIVLDALKAFIFMAITHYIIPGYEQYYGLAVCVGHCFPVFAGFKGGKAVACSYGYLLGLAVFKFNEYLFTFILPVIIFFIVLLIGKMVSLSSMISILSAAVIVYIKHDKNIGILIFILALFIIYRHSANIKRIINGTESKINLKKKS